MLLIVGICGGLILPLARPSDAQTLDLRDYEVSFEEHFNSLDISARGPGTRWIAHTPWYGDFGDAVFADPGPNGPFSLGDKGLRITARRGADGKWTSGLICSMDKDGPGQQGFAQRYGYFEMRAKLPDGPGTWPAFWLIGSDKRSSAAEVDVLEYYGHAPQYFHNVMHLFKNGKDFLSRDNMVEVPYGQLSSRFNAFGVLIEPTMTRFYLNRREIWTQPTPPEYNQKMYILANLALGGGWPIDKLQSPVTMDIESIMVFRKRGPPRAEADSK